MDDSLGVKLEDAVIPVIYVGFLQETTENHTASTLLLGKLFGKEDHAHEIVDFYVEHRSAVTTKIDEILKTQSRPNLYIEVGMMGASDFGNSFDNHYSCGGIAYLSDGQQLVFIAQTLFKLPHILIIDEPSSALELNRQFQLMEMIKNITEE